MTIQFEIQDELVAQGAILSHRVMEDGSAYTVEQVRQALVATVPRLVTAFFLYPEGIAQDILEARPAEFNDMLQAAAQVCG